MEGMNELPDCLMSPRELACLVGLAQGRMVLELGSWRGEATAAMALGAKCVWSVDWHRGDEGTGPADTLADYFATLRREGVERKVVSVVGRFDRVYGALKHASFDMVVVDGAHDAGSVTYDVVCAIELCRWPGIIAVHDFDRTEVARVATELLGPGPEICETLALYHWAPRP